MTWIFLFGGLSLTLPQQDDLQLFKNVNIMKKHLSFLILPIVMTVIIFLVFIVERLFMTSFADAGILPRTVSGLKGIFFGPLIHGDWSHLISNLSAFPVLLAMLTLVYRRNYVRIFAQLMQFNLNMMKKVFGFRMLMITNA